MDPLFNSNNRHNKQARKSINENRQYNILPLSDFGTAEPAKQQATSKITGLDGVVTISQDCQDRGCFIVEQSSLSF